MGRGGSARQRRPGSYRGDSAMGQAGNQRLDDRGQDSRTAACCWPLSKSGKVIGDELGDWAIWSVVEQSAKEIGIEHFGAHDLRRTCAKLCRKNGGDLEQIKFLLGHSSDPDDGTIPWFRAGFGRSGQ